MRIVFMGTPAFAVPTLGALLAAGHEIVSVYTQPPRPAGRGKQLSPSAVQQRAEALGLSVRHPASLKEADEQAAFAALEPDVAVVAAYGLILPRAVLAVPRMGCINVHASLLPRWRGAAPIHRAILSGDAVTGVTIMAMEAGLDTGPMLAVVETPVAHKTTGDLTDELARLGADLLVATLAEPLVPVPQPVEGVLHAPKVDKSEARIEFMESAAQTERQVRAFAPAPGAFLEWQGERIRVLAAEVTMASGSPGVVLDDALTIACNPGAIRPTQVQRAGRGVMTAQELLRGFPIAKGSRLS